MDDYKKTKAQLINELNEANQHIEELKSEAEILRHSEELHRIILNNISDTVFVSDDQGKLLFICPNVEVIFGFSKVEAAAIGNISRLLGDDLYSSEELDTLGEIVNIERDVINKDGETRTLLVNVKRVSIAGGTVLYTCHDITDRKQAEAARSQSDARLRAFANALPDPAFILNRDGLTIEVLTSQEELLYKEAEYQKGRKIEELFSPDQANKLMRAIQQVLDTQQEQSLEYEMEVLAGKRWFDSRIAPMPIADGNDELVILVARDITERKQAEKAIHFQAQLLGAVGQAIIATDLEGKITYWNHFAESLYGWSAREVKGQNIVEITPAASSTEQSLEIMSRLQRGKSWSGELMLQRKDGTVFPAWVVDAPIHDNDGNLIGIIGVSSDISERKQFENALHISETRLRAIFENSRDAIGLTQMGIHILENPAHLAMFGYDTSDKLEGKSVLDFIAPSEHSRINDYVRRQAKGHPVPSLYETRGRRKDGSEFDLEVRVSTYTLDDEVYTLLVLRDISTQKQIEQTLYFIAQKGWMADSQKFIESVVQFLGKQLNVAYTFVGKLTESRDSVETISVYANGEVGDNFTYALDATPCENVMGQELCCYPNNVQNLFPQDHLLQEMEIEGYMGLPLWDSKGKPSGIIVVLDTKPLHEIEKSKSILQIVADSVSREMERTQAELALQESAAQYQAIAATTLDGFLIIDRYGHFLDVNDRYCQMIGYSRDELLKLSLANIEVQETSEDIRLHIAEIIDKGFDRFQSQHRHQDGSVIDIEVSTTFMPETERFLAFFRDITSQKQSERMLQARLLLSELAINHSIDELLQKTLDEAERLTNSNIGFFHFLDTDQESLTLQTWSTNTLENMCTADAKGHHYPVSEAGVWVDCIHQRKPVIHNAYASLSHRQGMPEVHAPVVRELVVPIVRNDLIVAILGVGNKSTDYNNSDVEIIHQLANMAWDIIARKRTEIELHRSEELLALKNRFVSTVSHEFKTPLAVIQTSSDLLSRYFEKLTPERRENLLQQIRDQIVHLTEMVDNVLTLGRAESGKVDFNPAQLELTQFCQTIFDQVQFADNGQHQFIFTNNIPEQSIMADAVLLKHILTNLFSNAVKYSPDKSEIVFELDLVENNITIKVSDEGIGIPAEDQLRLFEPFHRASNVGDFQGTGMGLSIVKEYVELHGGSIEVESKVKEGSTFRVILPLA